MQLELSGRVVAVTGASGLIGRSTCTALLAEQASVLLCARSKEQLTATRNDLDPSPGASSTVPVDLTRPGSGQAIIDEAVRTFGRLDTVVNCAGTARRAESLADETSGDFLAALRSKSAPCVEATLSAGRYFSARQVPGVIVNVVGVGGLTPIDGFLPGGAANAALLLFTRGAADSFGRTRVLALSPAKVIRADALSCEHNEAVTPQDVAAVATFLVSRQAAALSGVNIIVGGRRAYVQ